MTKRKINLLVEGGSMTVEVSSETRFLDLVGLVEDNYPGQITLARVGNRLYELTEIIGDEVEEILFLDTRNSNGYRTYMRGLSYLFIIASKEVFPEETILMEHSISDALYCSIRKDNKLVRLDTRARDTIEKRMRQLVEENHWIRKFRVPRQEAMDRFEEMGRQDKVDLIGYMEDEYINIYKIGPYVDAFYGHMVPSTSILQSFSLELFSDGIVIIGPEIDSRVDLKNFKPNKKLAEVYREAEDWAELQGLSHVKDLNRVIQEGKIGEVCRMAEALHNYKIMRMAQEIKIYGKRVILISAPSSSGKTSFAHKLRTNLRVLGLRPITISMDNYYVNRIDTPLNKDGSYDFESIEAIDMDLFQEDVIRLLQGQSIEEIYFDFLIGERVHTGRRIQISSHDPIIIEGIHALHPRVKEHLDESYLFRIYLSVITQINLDNHNRIQTTDLRLMRRMARDMATRGKTVMDTIAEWAQVRKGEMEHIIPNSHEADIFFNSSFLFEIAMLKPLIIKELEGIGPDSPAYIEARRLRFVLQFFLPVEDTSDVVNTSILREFIGGSKIIH